MKYKYILFDLDGTLTDPGVGITEGVAHALRRSGIEPPERRELYRFIGPPLMDSFREYYGMSDERAAQAVKYYREYYSIKGLFENEVYPDIPKTLAALRESGHTLAVATSKPEEYSVKIIRHFGLEQYFDYIAGSDFAGERGRKADVIAYCLKALGVADKSSVLMVGDRLHDIEGAHECGLPCAGVLWGYGSREEFIQYSAEYILETPEEILEAVV